MSRKRKFDSNNLDNPTVNMTSQFYQSTILGEALIESLSELMAPTAEQDSEKVNINEPGNSVAEYDENDLVINRQQALEILNIFDEKFPKILENVLNEHYDKGEGVIIMNGKLLNYNNIGNFWRLDIDADMTTDKSYKITQKMRLLFEEI